MAAWVEAKRIRPASFQPHQLARTLHALLTTADRQVPLLLLVLGVPPPIKVASAGAMEVGEAITRSLPHLGDQDAAALLSAAAGTGVAWIMWAELARTVRHAADRLAYSDRSTEAAVHRMAGAVDRAIAWHS